MPPDKPIVIDEQGVWVEIHHGRWKIKTGWPSYGRSRLDVLVHYITDTHTEGHGTFSRQLRINLNSSSARNGLTSRIPAGPDRNDLQSFLEIVAQILAEQLETSGRPAFPDMTAEPESLDWLIYPFWPATGVTGLAAAPSSLKSFMSLAAALQIATGQEVLAGNTRTRSEPATVLYLDWEDNEQMFRRRLRAILAGAGMENKQSPVAYLNPKRSLAQSIEELNHRVGELAPAAIILDSMSAAIDGSMNDSDVVNEFYNAVHTLGAPTLVITHKSIENQRQRRAAFMGSGMSLARVRMAWNAEKAKNGAIVWECFKDNHGSRAGSRLAWQVGFDNSGDQDEYLDAVTIEAVNPSRVQITKASEEEKLAVKEAHYARIAETLDEAGPTGMLVSDLAGALDQTEQNIRNQLNDMFNADRLVKEKEGRKTRWWFPPHHESLLTQRNEATDRGAQDDLDDRPIPY